VAALVSSFGDDPDLDALRDDVGAQEAGAVTEGGGIGGAVMGVEVSPIAGDMAA